MFAGARAWWTTLTAGFSGTAGVSGTAGWLLGFMLAFACGIGSGFGADARMDANNKGVVELETEGSAGISIRMAEDLAGLIDDGATRRVLPVVGRSTQLNLRDLLSLRGIDMAILQTDVLDSMRQQGSQPGIESSFSYVAKLYTEELHLLVGPGVKTIADLAHKRVNIGARTSGTSTTAERLFDLVKVPIDAVNGQPEAALNALRHGDIAAMALVAGKPAPVFLNLRADDQLHFLPVPLEPEVINAYVPATLGAEDYPGVIATGQTIDTIAVGTLLAVARLPPGSDRYRNVTNFVETFFTEFRTLLEPGHHPKWRDINLAAELPGWTRFPPAQAWLDRNAAVVRQSPQDMKTLFSRFLDTRKQALGGAQITDQQKQDLFTQFQLWQNGQAR